MEETIFQQNGVCFQVHTVFMQCLRDMCDKVWQ